MVSAARRVWLRAVAGGVAAVLVVGACGRGVPEERVSSRGSKPGDATEAPPPPEATTSTIAPEVPTTSAPEPTTTSSTAAPPVTTPTTTKPKPAGACGSPTVTEFPLSMAGGKPTALTVAPDGAVWFTDTGHAAVGRLAVDGTVRMFPLTLNRQPAGIAVGPGGDVWFTQYAWYNAGRPASPPGQAPPDAATIGPPAIGRISGDGILTEFPLPTAGGNPMGDPMSGALPRGIVAGPDGAVWFSESGADQIGRITPDGTITEFPLPSRSTFHAFPDGIAVGPDGAIWFSETLHRALGRIDVATGVITEHRIEPQQPGMGVGPGHLVTGPDGALWFGSPDNVGRMSTGGKTTLFPIRPEAESLNALVAGPDGRLWFADDRSAAIFRMTTKGAVSRLMTAPGAPAKDWEALGEMAVGPDGSVWLATPSSNRILRISCTG
jgi:virginiamycin B lyase